MSTGAYGSVPVDPVGVVPDFLAQSTGMTPMAAVEDNADFHILGDICQVVQLKLKPGQQIQCEPGAMCYTVRTYVVDFQFTVDLLCILIRQHPVVCTVCSLIT